MKQGKFKYKNYTENRQRHFNIIELYKKCYFFSIMNLLYNKILYYILFKINFHID